MRRLCLYIELCPRRPTRNGAGMSWDYCEYPEFYSESFPRAKKEHRCIECFAPIEIGEMHLYYRGKWDNEFSVGRQHMLCRKLCMFIRDEFQDGECFGFGDLFETWRDHNFGKKDDEEIKKARSLMAQV